MVGSILSRRNEELIQGSFSDKCKKGWVGGYCDMVCRAPFRNKSLTLHGNGCHQRALSCEAPLPRVMPSSWNDWHPMTDSCGGIKALISHSSWEQLWRIIPASELLTLLLKFFSAQSHPLPFLFQRSLFQELSLIHLLLHTLKSAFWETPPASNDCRCSVGIKPTGGHVASEREGKSKKMPKQGS